MAKKKKEKLTKAQKLQLQKEEEERIRREEEEAQRIAEEEERKRQEEEQLRLEELEKIRNEEAEIRGKELSELLSLFHSVELIHNTNRLVLWEEWKWHCYVHEWKTINPLSLPMVNSFLATWEQDESCDMKEFFLKCYSCINIIHEVEKALLNSPVLDSKTEVLWNEILKNLKQSMNKKFDLITFLLLRSSAKYISPDSYNMEYGVTSEDFLKNMSGHLPRFTVCLWANFVKNIHYKGLEIPELSFKFELPEILVLEPCAVRFLYIPIDTVSGIDLEEIISEEDKIMEDEEFKDAERSQIETKEKAVKEHSPSKVYDYENDGENIEVDGDTLRPSLSVSSLASATSYSTEAVPQSEVSAALTDEGSFSVASTTFTGSIYELKPTDSTLKGIYSEKKSMHINIDEYSLVGGIFYFELLKIPSQPVETGCWILIHCEEKKPIKIPYKTTVTPIRQPIPTMSLAAAAEFSDSEIKRFEIEMSFAISISFRLPKDVLFSEQPIPAFWDPNKHCFTKYGFFDINFDAEDQQLSFKVDHFGKIALFQRKNINHPFQSWEICGGNEQHSVELVLTGAIVTLYITLNNEGCVVNKISFQQTNVLQELYNICMKPAELIHKLLSVGICIEYNEIISTCTGIPMKDKDLEFQANMCISLLCTAFSFSSSKWNRHQQQNCLILNCKPNSSESEVHLTLVTPKRAIYLKCTEDDHTFSEEAVDNIQFCSDLYHLIKTAPGNIEVAHADVAMHVFSLLQACRLFSC